MTKEVELPQVAIGSHFTLFGKRFKKVSPYMAKGEGGKEHILLLDEPTVTVEVEGAGRPRQTK